MGRTSSPCRIMVTTLWCICLICLTLSPTNLHWKLTAGTQVVLFDWPRNLILFTSPAVFSLWCFFVCFAHWFSYWPLIYFIYFINISFAISQILTCRFFIFLKILEASSKYVSQNALNSLSKHSEMNIHQFQNSWEMFNPKQCRGCKPHF